MLDWLSGVIAVAAVVLMFGSVSFPVICPAPTRAEKIGLAVVTLTSAIALIGAIAVKVVAG